MNEKLQIELQNELKKFNDFKQYFKKNHVDYKELDQFGFSLSTEKNCVDVLFTGLTHGNEIIGIQIINLILEEIKSNNKLNYSSAFLLNNIEAYKKNVRFIESDLNRSFCADILNTKEKKRAREIEKIVRQLKISLILDLHQTVEFTNSAFAVVPEELHLIQRARNIAKNFAIVAFPQAGFSVKGKTLIEFAKSLSIPALVYELGQKGFNDNLAHEFKDIVMNMNLHDPGNRSDFIIEYYLINDYIPNKNEFKLVEGLSSLQNIAKDQILAKNSEGFCFMCPVDSVIIFPCYKDIEKEDREIGLLAIKKTT